MGVTSLSSFGAGAVPAVNSFALCVVQMRGLGRAERNGKGEGEEDGGGAGRVFGALALIQAVGQQILGVRNFPYFSLENHSLLRILTPSLIFFFLQPMIFGVIYSTSVASFPKAIFTTAACILFISIIALAFLRPGASLKARRQYRKKVMRRLQEGGGNEGEVGVERGRSRVSKDLGVGGRGYGVGVRVFVVQGSSSEGSEGV